MTFKGFEKPTENYSKLPHSFIDQLPDIETISEMKVVLYLLRHTWGFSEFGKPKKLTTDEFSHGRKKRDQSRMDSGTGLSENSVRTGLEKAVEHGFILVETDESDRARIEKWYCLNMGDEAISEARPANFAPLGSNIAERSEKETIERKDYGSYEPTTIEQAIWADMPVTESMIDPEKAFEAKAKDAANLLDMACKGGGVLALEFMLSRHLIIPDSKIKGNRKAAREMLEMGVKPEHVTQAVTDLTRKGLTITDLFSISKTAIDLANKANNAPVDRSFGL